MVWRKRRSSSTTSTMPFAIIFPCPPAPLGCITNLFDHSPGQAPAWSRHRRMSARCCHVCLSPPGSTRRVPNVARDGAERREDHDRRGPHAQRALHANMATVLLHDRFGAGQADARTGYVPRRGGAIEGAEDMWQLVVRDAHPTVADGKDGS